MSTIKHIFLFTFLIASLNLFSQGDLESMLITEVDNLNPVYKPVLGVGIGSFNFLGDVKDPKLNPLNGTMGYKVNLSTFVDNNHVLRANFYFMGGSLSGNERSTTDLSRNLNFKSDILMFGINLNYDFDNLFKTYRKVHPFISIGAEILTFNSKIDSFGIVEGVRTKYHYWDDGTIRSLPQTPGNFDAPLMQRDFNNTSGDHDGYETNLRDTKWTQDPYPQWSFAIPVEAGLDFQISNRIMLRVAAQYHFTFTDFIDHVSSENLPERGGVVGNSWNDDFIFTYASMHWDMFSSKKTLTIERLFADIEVDYTVFYSDNDNDGVWDGWDDCPDTPFGAETDSMGCALDDDLDEVPTYRDDEPNSRYGAYVDERGVEMSEEALIALLDNSKAVPRQDVALYLREPSSYAGYKAATYKEIPENFKFIDANNDGYISFDEMMDAINSFFDFDSNLTTDEIYQLNDFFFSQ